MKNLALRPALIMAIAACLGIVVMAQAKPHPKPTPTAAEASPPAAEHASAPPNPDGSSVLAHWLLQQDGGAQALVLPLLQVMQAASGKTLSPLDRANPTDAAMVNRLGAALDGVLPSMNKADSSAHTTERSDEIAAACEDALAAKLGGSAEVSIAVPTAAGARAGSYPAFRVTDKVSGKSYYVGVTVYQTDARVTPARALRFEPAEAAGLLTSDGACVLVAIEYNGKFGREAAFLNWELLDLSKVPTRAAVSFEAGQDAVHAPDALLNDGRKGRD